METEKTKDSSHDAFFKIESQPPRAPPGGEYEFGTSVIDSPVTHIKEEQTSDKGGRSSWSFQNDTKSVHPAQMKSEQESEQRKRTTESLGTFLASLMRTT